MIERRSLTREQAEYAMQHGEFGPDVIGASPNVAIVLSQDWCSQYQALNAQISDLASRQDPALPSIVVFELLYNKVEYYQAFMAFKENHWRNYIIPYVRYYREGRLCGESNYVAGEQFLGTFKG